MNKKEKKKKKIVNIVKFADYMFERNCRVSLNL